MKLGEILKDVEIYGSYNSEIEIKGIASDSRKVKEGYIFVCIKGERRNGNEYIEEAFRNGCVYVISDDNNIEGDRVLITKNSRKALTYMWKNYYCFPDKDMKIIAITGTNGKTSTAFFVYNILLQSGEKCGLISTVKCMVDGEEYYLGGGSDVSDITSAMTTPDPEKLYEALFVMKNCGTKYVVMEASSHAISQEKLSALRIDIGIFTNLSDEHLDYHKTKENYFEAKAKLFEKTELAIINSDDEYGQHLAEKITCDKLLCSAKSREDFYAENIQITDTGSHFLLKYKEKSLEIKSHICGEYTIYNSMLACACCISLGIDEEHIISGIENLKNIDGRLEKISDKNIYIDYAHTPVAMEKVIKSVKKFLPHKKIIVLFGCGGDRDKTKRAKMGKIASDLCDNIIVTSDNSRSEDPIEIIEQIKSGISDQQKCVLIPKREDAIRYAIHQLSSNDVLLLLGKGHEKYEIDKNGKHYFNEKEIIISEMQQNDKEIRI